MNTMSYNKINEYEINLNIKGEWVGKYASSPINLNNEKIVDCLEVDKELQNKLAKNAKSNAARFSWDDSARQLIAVFERAISAQNRGKG